jgi:hypothetical protein
VRNLLIGNVAVFCLHYGFDGWHDVTDTRSEPQGLGMHGVRLKADILLGHAMIDFPSTSPKRFWEGEDHHIALEETDRGRADGQTTAMALSASPRLLGHANTTPLTELGPSASGEMPLGGT